MMWILEVFNSINAQLVEFEKLYNLIEEDHNIIPHLTEEKRFFLFF